VNLLGCEIMLVDSDDIEEFDGLVAPYPMLTCVFRHGGFQWPFGRN